MTRSDDRSESLECRRARVYARDDGKGGSVPLRMEVIATDAKCGNASVGTPKTDRVGRAGLADMGEGRLPCAVGP